MDTYKFIERIGSGGFGIVDLVENIKGERFARKTFSINNTAFPKSLEANAKDRFKREVKLQKAIEHQNIIPVIESDLTAEPPYYIMPLAVSALHEDIEKDRTLGGNYQKALFDIIAGLEKLHALKYFHRDLKPSNVLKFHDHEGEDYYAIGDFGLVAIKQTNVSQLTSVGMTRSSDAYTAGEIVADLTAANAQSDIFSLGCILHDFVGKTNRIPCHEIKERIGTYAAILQNCTKDDPKRRFKSVAAVRDALLSLGEVKIDHPSEQAEKIFKLLDNDKPISSDDWSMIYSFVHDNYGKEEAKSILYKMNYDRIDELIKSSPEIGNSFGRLYCKWIRESYFDFELCDGLAIRLKCFIDNCEIDVKSEGIISMLYLSTNHNRWYVQRMFESIVYGRMDDDLIARLAIDFRTEDNEICDAINHITRTIRFSRTSMQPLLYNTIKEICK